VLSDLDAPGWAATVETAGKTHPIPILRTNRIYRGVWLAAGTHRIEMKYLPPPFCHGAWISGLGWAVTLLLGGWSILKSPALRASGERR
jgi:hypothetical protein